MWQLLRSSANWLQSATLGTEELTGDNQYQCSVCRAKRDAVRQMRLRGLPPYLCLSRKRFIYYMKVSLLPAAVQQAPIIF